MKRFPCFLIFVFTLSACSSNPRRNHSSGTDFHMHVHSPPKEFEDDLQFTGQRALFAADSIGLNRALILSNSYSANVSEQYAIQETNFIVSEVLKDPTRLAGACAVNPKKDWARREIKRCASLGVKVLKLHLLASGMDLRKASDYELAKSTIRDAELNNFTIIIHANYPQQSRPGEIEKLKQLIEEFPKTRWIIGHLFGREFESLLSLNHSNYFVEVSIVPVWMKSMEQKEKLVRVMREVGIDKFVFGSDWPVIHPAELLKALNSLPLEKAERDAILYENAVKLNDLFGQNHNSMLSSRL